MYFLYSLLLGLLLLLTLPYWLVQALRHGKYRAGLGERLGNVPARLSGAASSIWVHAVSVGEVLAMAPVVEQLRRDMPQHTLFVSTTTATGQKLARQRFGEQNAFYFPLDFGWAIRPYLGRLRPALIVVAETEFWPNFLRLGKKHGARIAVVNARISDRSLPRYRAFRGLLRRVLENVHLFLAQSEQDARRLVAIGARPERVQNAGNLKFDVAAPTSAPIVDQVRAAAAGAPVIVAGSTVEGEEPLVLAAFAEVLRHWPEAVLALAPRHPERFTGVAALVQSSGVPLQARSAWQGDSLSGKVLLLDTIGELAGMYAVADVAFVGGSLVPRGGHNILEPAQFGRAIVTGKHTENFRDITETLRRADAVHIVGNSDELRAAFLELLDDAAKRAQLGERARAVVEANRGATQRTIWELEKLLRGGAQ